MADHLVGIEAGGTKFYVVLGDSDGQVIDRTRVDTSTPDETMPAVIAAALSYFDQADCKGVGLGCFGPLELSRTSDDYGCIMNTPKAAWKHYPILKTLESGLGQAVVLDTDVNAALYAESYWGAAVGYSNAVYVTVGTGIGAGVMANNEVIHGATHTELGHMRVGRAPQEIEFPGGCIYHGDCLEGMASGPAMKQRWDVQSALDLPDDHLAWDLEATYLAYMVHNILCCFSSEIIILGGGVMKHPGLIDRVREKTQTVVNGYLPMATAEQLEKLIVPASFGDNTGVKGVLALASMAREGGR